MRSKIFAKLDISANELRDVGAGYLRGGLKNENCKLTALNISDNVLTGVASE